MKRTFKLTLMICLSALAAACAPKEPVKYLALAFDDGHTMYTVVPDGRYN